MQASFKKSNDMMRRSSPGKFSIHAAHGPNQAYFNNSNKWDEFLASGAGSGGAGLGNTAHMRLSGSGSSPRDPMMFKASQTDNGFYNYSQSPHNLTSNFQTNLIQTNPH